MEGSNLFESGALAQAVQDSFENMAFAEIEPCGPFIEPGLYTKFSSATLDLFGLGILKIAIEAGKLHEIGETLYGDISGSEAEGRLKDTLLEITNIVAGRYLAIRLGEGSDISLGLPEFQDKFDLASWPNDRSFFKVDGREALLVGYQENKV